MHKDKRGKKTVSDNITKRSVVPIAACGNGVHIELLSNKEAIVDGIKGVIEYNDSFVKLNIGRGTVEFWGSELEILSLDTSGLCIKGNISKIEYC